METAIIYLWMIIKLIQSVYQHLHLENVRRPVQGADLLGGGDSLQPLLLLHLHVISFI